jgi:hypothetical protein
LIHLAFNQFICTNLVLNCIDELVANLPKRLR